jgi:hypothetical protein
VIAAGAGAEDDQTIRRLDPARSGRRDANPSHKAGESYSDVIIRGLNAAEQASNTHGLDWSAKYLSLLTALATVRAKTAYLAG